MTSQPDDPSDKMLFPKFAEMFRGDKQEAVKQDLNALEKYNTAKISLSDSQEKLSIKVPTLETFQVQGVAEYCSTLTSHVINDANEPVELWVSVGTGDFFASWISRLYLEPFDWPRTSRKPNIKSITVRHPTDAYLTNESSSKHDKLEHWNINKSIIEDIVSHGGPKPTFRPWMIKSPLHGYMTLGNPNTDFTLTNGWSYGRDETNTTPAKHVKTSLFWVPFTYDPFFHHGIEKLFKGN